jgi:hypothetical protein
VRHSLFVILFAAMLCPAVSGGQAPSPPKSSSTDLDQLMARALQRREIDRKVLSDYVLDEVESFDVLGPDQTPFKRSRREYTWYVRDGIHVRSPLKFDGVPIPESDRRKYEDNWLHEEQERQKRRAEKAAEREKANKPSTFTGPPTEPRFVSEAYFLEFRFEPGNYYLAGHDTVDGRDVLKVDYYPTNLFNDDDEGHHEEKKEGEQHAKPKEKSGKERREEAEEQDLDKKMNKTALVTLWVDPASAQIVKYTFENVWMDFLPAAWLIRIDALHASMEMEQPFPGVWLPRNLSIDGQVTMAPGSFGVTYRRAFTNYRKADVSTRIRVPKDAR